MEHHYSLTTRMLVIFNTSLILLAALIFAAGLLIGREWAMSEVPALPVAPLKGLPQPKAPAVPQLPKVEGVPPALPAVAAPPANAATGSIRLPDPASIVPSAPAPAAVPAPRSSSGAAQPQPDRVAESADAASAPESSQQRKVAARSTEAGTSRAKPAMAKQVDDASRTDMRGYVVYVGAFDSQSGADSLVEELRSRKLNAQTSTIERSGGRQMIAVWVGVFDDRSAARAVMPTIREAGVTNSFIRHGP